MVVVRASLGKIGSQSNKERKNMFATVSVTFFRPQDTQLFLLFYLYWFERDQRSQFYRTTFPKIFLH